MTVLAPSLWMQPQHPGGQWASVRVRVRVAVMHVPVRPFLLGRLFHVHHFDVKVERLARRRVIEVQRHLVRDYSGHRRHVDALIRLYVESRPQPRLFGIRELRETRRHDHRVLAPAVALRGRDRLRERVACSLVLQRSFQPRDNAARPVQIGQGLPPLGAIRYLPASFRNV